ncbi:MAG: ABC transporter ATP-binding protein [Lentisphaerae bacterium]|nr:MAG: ABC transporter ATP-binding protein [Lentisphaerota bacterium]
MNQNGNDPLLRITNLCKEFRNRAGAEPRILFKNLNLILNRGEKTTIEGVSGSGKTTLLNMIAGLDQPSSGEIIVAGEHVSSMSIITSAPFRHRYIGFLFQFHHLLPQCNVLENILLPTLGEKAGDTATERAQLLLARVGLGDRAEAYPSELSGGECQRVALVRALIRRPALVLADEPTGALDQETAKRIITLLLEMQEEEQFTLIVATHAPAVAKLIGNRLYIRNYTLQRQTE